jgi:DNA-binding response OmpR family regulator
MPGKALVVDDDADIREILAEQLATHGFEVLTAGNGLEALLHVKRERPGAVVLDLAMPRLGGLEALKRIRAFLPEAKVVIVSGYLDGEVRRQELALGAAGVLEKPISLADLLVALGEIERPARPPTKPRGEDSGKREPPVMLAAEPGRVLVVDDDPEMRAMLSDFLTIKGYSAQTVPDGATALREIVTAPPDVVLLDINMPGLSGLDALPTIRAVAPRTVVIMVSATEDAATAKRVLAYGAFDYVVKPIDLQYLSRSIETALLMAQPEL